MSNEDDESVAENFLRGAGAIAKELYGDEKDRRKVYGMPEQEKRELGLFYRGKLICGWKPEIRKRVAAMAAGGAQ